MALHNIQPVGEIHQIHQWAVANAAARAALVLVSTDIGKVCKQNDINEFFVLVNNVGPIWSSLNPAVVGTSDMFSILTAAEIAVTTTATLTLGRMHVCSGTTADYTVTLPTVASNAGKFLGLRIAPGCTRWITLKGNASENIDGVNTRLMWAHESAILFCDGVTWTKLAGKTVPIQVSMYRTAALNVAAVAWTVIPTTLVTYDNTAGVLAVPAGDTSTGVVKTLRAGRYQANGFASATAIGLNVPFVAGVMTGTGSTTPTGNPNAWTGGGGTTTGFGYGGNGGLFNTALGTNFYITAYNGNASVVGVVSVAVETRPTLTVSEQPTW